MSRRPIQWHPSHAPAVIPRRPARTPETIAARNRAWLEILEHLPGCRRVLLNRAGEPVQMEGKP